MFPASSGRKINAFPTKSFFTTTLVKDIDLIDAILDLIDNAIDGYIKNIITEKKRISILLSENEFIIEDDCGGIKKEEIYDHVFRFGKSDEKKARTIGIYGIGLKRAIFKMGNNILIESDDGTDSYSIRIDEDWLKTEDNWFLKFENEGGSKGPPMTRIKITNLFSEIAEQLKSSRFENELRARIRDTYSMFMEERVAIELNNKPVDCYEFKFLCDNEEFAPFHKRYMFGDVEVEIFAGYTLGGREKDPYGWYVFCNDRLIIRNDTSDRTGWGGYGERKYHYPQDDRLLGLVFFRSDDPALLPLQTTKDDIQYDSRVYRAAQLEMKAVTARLVNVIRLAYETKDDMGNTIGAALFEGIQTKTRKEITVEQQEIVPTFQGDKKVIPKLVHISYMVESSLAKKVKEKLGDAFMPNRKMGEKTLEYYVKMQRVMDE